MKKKTVAPKLKKMSNGGPPDSTAMRQAAKNYSELINSGYTKKPNPKVIAGPYREGTKPSNDAGPYRMGTVKKELYKKGGSVKKSSPSKKK